MPITHVLDRSQRRVRTVVTGSVTVDDILGYIETARHEQTIPFAESIDVRGVTPPWLSATDIWRAAGLARNFKSDEKFGPRAVIVGSDLMFGTVRMFANLVQDFAPMNVFHDPEQAEAWLAKSSSPADSPGAD